MPDQWEFLSHTYDNCNCSVSCGCQFNEPTTYGNCDFAYTGTIIEGFFNDTPLAGLRWSLMCKFPGEIAEGNGKRQIVIDEKANDAQRKALETIISGEACAPLSNHFSVFGSLCTKFFETLFLPIELEVELEARTAKVNIPGLVQSVGRPIINAFNGEPFHIAIARPAGSFEFTYGEIGRGTTAVTGDLEMAFEDSWALFCVHHYNQDGLIRGR
jgi:hypothetical protein